MSQDNVIPLFINSADRINIDDSTTDFTVSLRKSLRNIAAVEVSNVVIPKTEPTISNNNNTLSGSVIVDSIVTPFTASLTNGNYTAATLAAAVQTMLNTNTTMLSFPVTWVVTYSSTTQKMSIVATYPLGATHVWGISFDHTALINVLGVGTASTTTQTYTANTAAIDLNIPCNRVAILSRGLSYNITSSRLTNNINTSFLQSLGKEFDVTADNNSLLLNGLINTAVNEASVPTPPGIGQDVNAFRRGYAVAISSDGNIIATGTDLLGVFIFRRISPSTDWIQMPVQWVLGDLSLADNPGQGSAIALSGDGGTLAIGSALSNPAFDPGVRVLKRVGDSWIQQGGYILGTGVVGAGSKQGYSVSLSIDGSTLAVGGPADDTDIGAVWMYELIANVWTQVTKLLPSTPLVTPLFGSSVSLSGSGDKLIVGGFGDNTNIGAFWSFTRTGSTWSAGTKIIPGDAVGAARVGTTVSVSADGNYVAVGALSDNTTGATWAYLWTGPTPTVQQKIIIPARGSAVTTFTTGGSCSLNSSGDILAIGTQRNDLVSPSLFQGSTTIYTRSGATWTAQANNLVGDANETPVRQYQGISVALSAIGNILVTGGPGDPGALGAAWIFTQSSTVWSQHGAKLVGTGEYTRFFGSVFALSADGLTLVSGYEADNVKFVFKPQGTTWVLSATLFANNRIGDSGDGSTVAISGDGTILASGGPDDDSNLGAVWVHTYSTSSGWVQTAKIFKSGQVRFGNRIALNANGDTLAIAATPAAGVTMMNRSGLIWIETVSGLGSSSLGGFAPTGLSISDDGATMVMSALGVGAAVFVLSNGVWSQQGANLSTLVTLVDVGSVTFGASCTISPDGNKIAVGSTTDGVAGCGAAYVFVRTGTTWAQQGVGLVGTPSLATNAQGSSVAFINAGTTLAVGAPTATGGVVGRVWLYDLNSTTWSQRGVNPLLGSQVNAQYGVSLSGGGSRLAIGEPRTTFNIGALYVHSELGTMIPFTVPITVPIKSYTIFDVTRALTTLMADTIGSGAGYIASFDGGSLMTLTAYFASPIMSSTFVVDLSSTFNIARWLSTEYKSAQTSSRMDMSINNDVLKSIVNHSDNSDNVIVDSGRDIQYRKYGAGYTITSDDVVDIQLRNNRDHIVDLQGADWIMTIYATVRS